LSRRLERKKEGDERRREVEVEGGDEIVQCARLASLWLVLSSRTMRVWMSLKKELLKFACASRRGGVDEGRSTSYFTC
jgi:hypothetical protein